VEKADKCPQCKKIFSESGRLTVSATVHTGRKQFFSVKL